MDLVNFVIQFAIYHQIKIVNFIILQVKIIIIMINMIIVVIINCITIKEKVNQFEQFFNHQYLLIITIIIILQKMVFKIEFVAINL